MKRFKRVGVGGTFDVLHKGHEALLEKAFEIGELVVIGITLNEMLEKEVTPYNERRRTLEEFLKNEHYEILELKDIYGPAIEDIEMNAIVVSEETEETAEEINQKRLENGLASLEIITIPMVLAYDEQPISSSRIRAGEIDKEGRSR